MRFKLRLTGERIQTVSRDRSLSHGYRYLITLFQGQLALMT